MYEFLAPWGIFAPALCAAVTYFLYQKERRKRLLAAIQAPASLALLMGSDIVIID